MKRTPVLVLGLMLILFLSWAGTASAQPKIPHPLEGRDNCLACHGPGGVKPFPASHAGRTNDICLVCHQAAVTTVPSPATVPAAAPTATAPTPGTPFVLPKPIPLSGGLAEATCVTCHRNLGGSLAAIVKDWEVSAHKARDVGCTSCHGGDPTAADKNTAMSAAAGFIGRPAKADIPALCGACHADATQMRQYNLPTDQLAEYRTSQHGQLLAKGDKNVPTCADCHGGHAIRPKSDPQATVYPTNVPATCAKCHANAALMKSYGIPTDQLEKYKDSVHGITLLQKQDLRAPSCANCHGFHGATPPGFAEVANVCGQCHSATEALYLKGGHASGAQGSGAPRCVTCHGQHDVKAASEDAFQGADPRHCGSCHAQGSAPRQTAEQIGAAITAASQAYDKAQKDVSQAEASRMIVVAEVGKLNDAKTALIEARAAQHTVSLATVEEKTKTSQDISQQVQEAAQRAVADSLLRRQGMVVAVALIAVVMLLLWLMKRQVDADLEKGG